MKRFVIYSGVALMVLAAATIAFSREKERWGGRRQRAMKWRQTIQDANDPNATAVEDPNRPARRGRRLENLWLKRVESLQAIRQIAADEGATKTVAALDELIAKEKKQHERMLERTGRRQAERGPAGDHPRRRFMRDGHRFVPDGPRGWRRGTRPPEDIPEDVEEQ